MSEYLGTRAQIAAGVTGYESDLHYTQLFYYYIATRGVEIDAYSTSTPRANWGIFILWDGGWMGAYDICNSNGNDYEQEFPLAVRPVVVVPQTVTDGDFAVSENTELPEWNDPLGIYQDSGDSSYSS